MGCDMILTLQEHDWVLVRGDGWFANAYKSGVSMVAPSRDGDGGTEMADMEGGMGHRSQHMLVCAPLRGRVDSTRLPVCRREHAHQCSRIVVVRLQKQL